MKKFTSAFAVCFALAIVYAALTSRVTLMALALTGGNVPALVDALFLFVTNCIFALLVGIFAGVRPLQRFWAVLPAPVILILTSLFVTGSVPALYYACAIYMFALSLLGLEIFPIVRTAIKLAKKA